MSTLPGSGVPNMMTVLPPAGGDLSDSVWMIFVGAASYCLSLSWAVATPLEVDPEEEDDDEDEDEDPDDESDESDPHAESATAVATTAMAASHFLMIGGPM